VASHALWAELLTALVISAIALAHGVETATSAFLGGLISLVPNVYFARRVLGAPADEPPLKLAGLMIRAEFTKLSLAVLMLAGAFALIETLNVLALLMGFVLVKVAGVVATVRKT
jgi:ATP synthase protein I